RVEGPIRPSGPVTIAGNVVFVLRAAIKAILSFASTDPTREQCAQIRVEPGRILATDGATLAVVRVAGEGESFEPYNLSRYTLDQIVRPASVKSLLLRPLMAPVPG